MSSPRFHFHGLRYELVAFRELPQAPVEPTCVALNTSAPESALSASVLAPRSITTADIGVEGPTQYVHPGSSLQFSLVLGPTYECRSPLELREALLAAARVTAIELSFLSGPGAPASDLEPLVPVVSVNALRPSLDITLEVPAGAVRGSTVQVSSIRVAGLLIEAFPKVIEVTLGMHTPLLISDASLTSETLLTPCISQHVSGLLSGLDA
jgi:hypothetical protein